VKGTCPHCSSDSAYGDQCENCGRALEQTELINPISTMTQSKPELRETTHWFLQLDKLQGALAEWLRGKKDPQQAGAHWRPIVINQSVGRIEVEGLPERAMTRDMAWGVPVPLDDPDARGKVLYVWFDAPIGYVSFTAALCAQRGEGEAAYERWWKNPACKVVNFIGEDNIVFHAITFPAMLLATHASSNVQGDAGEFQLPHNVVANSFLNFKFPGKDEEKMSKSRGTAVWIEDYLKDFDPDPLRYYLTAIAPEQQRSAFELKDFVERNNSELLAALGNFVNRAVTFTHKYFEGKIPPAGALGDVDNKQLAACAAAVERVGAELEACHFKNGLGELMAFARTANAYYDATAPHQTRKTDMIACGRAIHICLQTVRTLTTLMAPFLPFAAEKCLRMLRLGPDALRWDSACDRLTEGAALGEAEYLVKKLDPKEVLENVAS
jgi:methionyl-tRNA synthetase